MSFRLYLTPRFDDSVRKLKRRFPRINQDIARAFEEIEQNPEVGSVIPDDFSIRKHRVASRDLRRGKRGGYRLLYKLIPKSSGEVQAVMLFMYAKSDFGDVSSFFLEDLDDDMPEH